ncbi:MAG: glycosyltransferase family 4 protein, partial [Lactobacillus sp.]|nr:glycosyltransferase family 4 protein [Lactobacillus sp.]
MSDNKEIVVLQVLPELNQGGVEQGTIQIAEYLNKNGIKNFVASQGGRWAYRLDKANVPHFTLPLKTKNIFKMRANTKALEKIIRENGVSIVHARSRAPAWSAYWAAKNTGVQFMTTFHGTYGLGPMGIKKLYNRVMTYGKKVVAISTHIRNHILSQYKKTDPNKVVLIHRCVDLDKFDPKKISQERIIKFVKEYSLPEDKPIILTIGRLTRWKGQHLVIDAASSIKDQNFHCIFLGDDQGRVHYTEELKEAISKKGLEGRFTFISHTDDVPALMQISSIVVVPSTDPEAFGRMTAEGQAMGKIVVAS